MNEPVSGNTGMPYVSQGRRRRWVLGMYLCVAAVMLWLAFGGDQWSTWLAVVPTMAATTLYFKLISPINESLAGKEDRELDERQLAVRNRAYFHAFRIFGLLVFGTILYGASAVSGGSELPTPSTTLDFGVMGIIVAFLLGSLPAAAAAWAEPDPDLDE